MRFIILFFFSSIIVFSQDQIISNRFSIPRVKLLNDLKYYSASTKKDHNRQFQFFINFENIFNDGHPNIDNYSEIHSFSKSSRMISSRIEFSSRWISMELEPFLFNNQNVVTSKNVEPIYKGLNNFNFREQNNYLGFRQSRIIIHHNGFGISYGKHNNWWGPGFHSAISLSSNAPSQTTYTLGTFKDLKFGRLSFGSQIIGVPYKSQNNNDLYFTGLHTKASFSSSNTVLSLGFHRTYLSGKFNNENLSSWSMNDALRLVLEPLFGQDKANLNYTESGTPGFDIWDQVLTVYSKIKFPKDNFEIYIDIATDDARANFTDLLAHWDHTLGFQLGFKKYYLSKNYSLLFAAEITSTKEPNTFKQSFFRGVPGTPNFYYKPEFDFFTYNGRIMGAHSGPSSDDVIFLIGYSKGISTILFSLNRERNALKAEENPQLKHELTFTYEINLKNNISFSFSFENELINNYSFRKSNLSSSNVFWISSSYSFSK